MNWAGGVWVRVYMHTGGGEHVYFRFSEQGPETTPLGAWPVQPGPHQPRPDSGSTFFF